MTPRRGAGRIDRRRLGLGLAGVLAAPRFALAAADPSGEPPPVAEPYAEARRGFRTHLLRKGPAPDKGDPLLPPPPGAREVLYRSGDLDLVAWASEAAPPAGEALRPAILFLHGGNALWRGHWDLTQPFREAGFLALMPALRAENGQKGAFSAFYDEVDDVLAAAETLRAQPGVDRSRLYLAGHSVGGTLALLGALASPLFRAADARAFFRRYPEDIRFDAEDPREFTMRSAASFAASFQCPVLMLHGSAETRTEDAIRLTAARGTAAGRDVRHGVVPGDHTSAIPDESAEALRFFASLQSSGAP